MYTCSYLLCNLPHSPPPRPTHIHKDIHKKSHLYIYTPHTYTRTLFLSLSCTLSLCYVHPPLPTYTRNTHTRTPTHTQTHTNTQTHTHTHTHTHTSSLLSAPLSYCPSRSLPYVLSLTHSRTRTKYTHAHTHAHTHTHTPAHTGPLRPQPQKLKCSKRVAAVRDPLFQVPYAHKTAKFSAGLFDFNFWREYKTYRFPVGWRRPRCRIR